MKCDCYIGPRPDAGYIQLTVDLYYVNVRAEFKLEIVYMLMKQNAMTSQVVE
jgi:hypothetical protein